MKQKSSEGVGAEPQRRVVGPKKERLLPYSTSRTLTPEEMRQVAGAKCVYTNTPSADVSCTF